MATCRFQVILASQQPRKEKTRQLKSKHPTMRRISNYEIKNTNFSFKCQYQISKNTLEVLSNVRNLLREGEEMSLFLMEQS